MNKYLRTLTSLALLGLSASAQVLTLKKGDHISVIGNTLADRQQHDGWVETLIQAHFPDYEISYRDLGFSGDELTLRLRSEKFGTPDEWLTQTKADVVLAYFGYNESYGGQAGLEKFKKDFDKFIKDTLAKKYNGASAPRLVVFSPIAHENLKSPNVPDGVANNDRLKLYTDAMAAIAKENNVAFVDLFTPSKELYAKSKKPLTLNGVHLTEYGDEMLAPVIAKALFGDAKIKLSKGQVEKVRAAVLEKNHYWFNRYRTVDGYNVYGGRSFLKFVDDISNRDSMQREMQVLDVITANRDKKIWGALNGKDVKVDDSNTPPFIEVKSNKTGKGPNGEHLFLDGEEAISHMKMAQGMKVNLFASEKEFPLLEKPVQMAWDTKGRLWVATWPTYPHWQPKEQMRDKLVVLEDTNGDGKADKMTVFADHLNCPTGFEFWNNGVLLAQAPDLLHLKDTDGDGKADHVERVLNGLDSADSHHTANSFVFGPGGDLYFQEGTFHHTQVETPWGPPVRSANGAVFRFDPRTFKFDVYVAYGFANPHGHVFDRWGQDFVTDGTGNVNYYAAAFSGHLDFPKKHKHIEPFFKQRSRPCAGTEILSSSHFPDEMQGDYLMCNVIGFQGIFHYRPKDQDSGFNAEEMEPIVQSDDPNFRPADLEVGPDGALYFLDWQNPIIGHMQHHLRDPSRDHTHGRIYRVTYPSRPLLKPAKIAGESIDKLIELLKSPDDRIRYRARIELSGRPTKDVISSLEKWMNKLDSNDKDYQHHMLEALWLYQAENVLNEPLLKKMLRSPDARARAAATRVLCYWHDRLADSLTLLKAQVNDDHPRVRLEAVRACSFFQTAEAADVALESLNHPSDRFLKYTLDETMTALDKYTKQGLK
jgi:glucose/arabinose dehydrogenase